ncbi:Beta-glucosidase [Pleurostoma richardsiae]|uniref:beta-glucosidase n=1 Tax=Pleurostoma richardsiae TaxID=41990 RepID=A0AA38R738_9PEZI|nr:Beta-glucosidase [Pleurostoma richardsiae]
MRQEMMSSNPLPGSALVGGQALDVEAVLKGLSLQEKIALMSGVDNWHLKEIPRFGIPAIRVSDGPNGIRGTKMFNGSPAACLPCGTALAATWDPDLIRRGGELQADEAIAKGVSVILGPTVNTQRSPLGGRGFESFSEDPVLAGSIAAATIAGIQSKGVSATIKHFVCNDQEHERMRQDSRVSQRALREIYALPFQIALRQAKPWAFMSSYNRVNGIHVSEDPYLLRDVLRGEWGFDGLVMSDWNGTYSTAEAIKAGLDLEMPGPTFMRGRFVNHAILCGKLHEDDIDACARRILQFIDRVMPLGIPSNAPEQTVDTKETAAQLRELGSSSIVLLKNQDKVLPFAKEKSIAVIGPNAKVATYSGGGSAGLPPYYAVTPFDGISASSTGRVGYAVGCAADSKPALITNMMPHLNMSAYDAPPNDPSRQKIDDITITEANLYFFDYCPPLPSSHRGAWYVDFSGTLCPEFTGDYLFSLSVAGTARLFVDGKLVVDASTHQTPGGTFFGFGTGEIYGRIKLEKGHSYKVTVEFGSLATSPMQSHGADSKTGGGIRIGCAYQLNAEEEIQRAVTLAKQVDQVAIIAGLNADWESEGYDRDELGLPGHTDRLIREVLAANPNTAIVIQSGTPVAMPWVESAPAIMQAWYGGNETGNAIADVLFGDVNPAAKLPLTFPVRLEDTPTYLNFGSERGRTLYGEDIFVGYRFYEKSNKGILFSFGHGLSYTDFEIDELRVEALEGNDTINVSVSVQNTGSRAGGYVAQVYVSQRQPSIIRPVKELKGFAKVFLDQGEKKTLKIPMSLKYATSYWDEQKRSWAMEKDTFDVFVGSSSADDKMLSSSFEVSQARWWNGL